MLCFILTDDLHITKHLESWGTIHMYLEIGLKSAVVSCLIKITAPPPIALESCSHP